MRETRAEPQETNEGEAVATPDDHGRPGIHGPEVDKDRATSSGNTISEVHVLMHLAVRAHPGVSLLEPSTPCVTHGLDEIAERDADQREAGMRALSVHEQTEYSDVLWRLANDLRLSVDAMRVIIADNITQYLRHIDRAIIEWNNLDDQEPFGIHRISIIGTHQYAIVAVADALSLTLAEALVVVRNLAAARAQTPPHDEKVG